RNEMSDLEELGFLEQPHTSAGRVPSDKAYRLYVNSIMRHASLTEEEARYVERYFTSALDRVEDVVRQTARAISDMTKYTSMVLSPQLYAVKLKHIQLVPVTENKALAVVVTDAGIARDTFIYVPSGLNANDLERLSRMLTERFAGMKTEDAAEAILREMPQEMRERREFAESVVKALGVGAGRGRNNVEVSGTTNLLNYPEFSNLARAKAFLSSLEEKEMPYEMLTAATKVEFSITIGSENEKPDLKGSSVVTATYKIGDSTTGSLGVIGPTRMDYARVLAVLRHIGKSLGDVLTNMYDTTSD
ncbi:MAG: heat-inducible transcriptional repressor HrcA, partial [Clostridiaceae bacterium]|nr:heat-inducible transcriptional repressor HrcA [Eubacteriales bacterium]